MVVILVYNFCCEFPITETDEQIKIFSSLHLYWVIFGHRIAKKNIIKGGLRATTEFGCGSQLYTMQYQGKYVT